ncbi:MAG TPA: glutathione transferase GstA [Caulobacteraceae bacterium]|jgi:glutathione S-transferase
MKLYFAPGACSLADHIALREAGLAFDPVRVDLKAKKTEDGQDYAAINPKGYVPALAFDDGAVLTENVAILSWIADQASTLAPKGVLARYRLLEMLAYLSSEVHKAFAPFFNPAAGEADKAKASQTISRRLGYIADRLDQDYLFGPAFSVADAYLFVMEMWAKRNGLPLADALSRHVDRVSRRPAVREALEYEGLAPSDAAAEPDAPARPRPADQAHRAG